MLSGLVTTIRRLGAEATRKIRPRLTVALAALAAVAAAAGLFAAPASAAITGRAARTEATRISVTPDGEPAGMFRTQADCLTAGWGGYYGRLWSDSYQCVPVNVGGTVYWQLIVDYYY